MRPPLFRASDRSYLVSRADGSRGSYNLSEWNYAETQETAETSVDETSLEEGGRCVPVFCDQCFGGTSWDTRKAPTVQELTRLVLGSEGKMGVCGVANMVEPEVPGWRKPEFDGDMVIKNADSYYQHHRSAQHMFQPCEEGHGLRYGHGPKAGRVIAYWHDHRGEHAFNLCALATVESRDAREALEQYVADPNGSIALSLGNFQLGRDEIISELSVVLVPGRVGCFGKLVRSSADMVEMLGNLRFPATQREPPGHPLSHLTLGHGERCGSKAEVIEATLKMVAFHRDILKLAKTHPGRSSTEKYINYGIGRYSQLTRRPPPKLLTASAMSALTAQDETLNTTAAMVAGKMMMAPILDMGMNMIKELNAAAKTAKAVKRRHKRRTRRHESDEESESDSEESEEEPRAKRRNRRHELGREEIAFVRAEVKRREEERKRDALMTELKACLQAETASTPAAAQPPPVIAAGLALPTHTTMPGDHTLPALTAMVQRELKGFMDQFKKAHTMPVVEMPEAIPTILQETATAAPTAAAQESEDVETKEPVAAPPAPPATLTAAAAGGEPSEIKVSNYFKQLMG